MLNVTLITVGTLKEPYLRAAAAEYEKRLQSYCRLQAVTLKEVRLPDDPGAGEIAAALSAEGRQILAAVPPRAYRVALCVEGTQLSSGEDRADARRALPDCRLLLRARPGGQIRLRFPAFRLQAHVPAPADARAPARNPLPLPRHPCREQIS